MRGGLGAAGRDVRGLPAGYVPLRGGQALPTLPQGFLRRSLRFDLVRPLPHPSHDAGNGESEVGSLLLQQARDLGEQLDGEKDDAEQQRGQSGSGSREEQAGIPILQPLDDEQGEEEWGSRTAGECGHEPERCLFLQLAAEEEASQAGEKVIGKE